jgi:hypothetical protein
MGRWAKMGEGGGGDKYNNYRQLDNIRVVNHADFYFGIARNLHKTNQYDLQTQFAFWFVSTVIVLVTALLLRRVIFFAPNSIFAGEKGSSAGGNGVFAGGNGASAGGNDASAGGNDASAGGNGTSAGGNGTSAGGNGTSAGGNGTSAGGNGTSADENGAFASENDRLSGEDDQSFLYFLLDFCDFGANK